MVPRQEYLSRLSFPFQGNIPDPGNKPMSPAWASGFFTTEPPGKPCSSSDDGHSYQCEMMPQCSFDLQFSDN